jgi:hypothetical protein
MENESKKRLAESGSVYEAPRVEVLEVMVERGYNISGASDDDTEAIGSMKASNYDLGGDSF